MSKRTQIGFRALGRRIYNKPQTYSLRTGSQLAGTVITIYNRSGGIAGKLFSTVGRSTIKDIEFSFDKHGCSSFKLELTALPSFSIDPYYFIGIKHFNTSFTWYSGLILDVPEYGTKKRNYEFSGQGFSYYLTGSEGLKAEHIYPAVTDIGALVAHMVQNYIIPYCPINYNSSKITNPIGTSIINDVDISKAPIADVLDLFADMIGARWGVDGDRDLYFELKPAASQKTRFAGYQTYSFEPKTNNRDIKNSIVVTRQAGAGSNENGWAVAGVYNDDTSIAKYGKRELIYQIPAFFDDDDADIIGAALLAQSKDPQISAEFSARLKSADDFYETQKNYRTILPYSDFNDVWLPLDDKTEFTKKDGTGNSTINDDTDFYVYGARGIRFDYNMASDDLWVNDTVDFSAGRIDYVRFWVRATHTGNYFTIRLYTTSTAHIDTSVPVPVTRRWFPIDIKLPDGTSTLDAFGIRFDLSYLTPRSVWIDKVEVVGKRARAHTLNLDKITYIISPQNGTLVKGDFGQNLPTMGDYVQSLLKQAAEFKYVSERR